MSGLKIKYSLVIPAYNEAGSLNELFERLKKIVVLRRDLEVLLVDNGSDDETKNLSMALQDVNKEPRLRFIIKKSNTGYGAGLKFGFSNTTAPFLIWTHADMQCDPIDVIRAIEQHEQAGSSTHYIVKGFRSKRSILDQTISFSLSLVNKWVNGIEIDDINAQPNIISREILKKTSRLPDDSTFELYLLTEALRSHCKLIRFPVLFLNRQHGIGFNQGYLRKIAFSLTCVKTILSLRRKRVDT